MNRIIAQIKEFFKDKFSYLVKGLVDLFWAILVLLLLILMFFLGRVTTFMEKSPTFSFESKLLEDENFEKERNSLFGKVSTSTIVASSGGTKYYFVWCSGAKNIKESNKRYFNTEEMAKRAGYTLANNCK